MSNRFRLGDILAFTAGTGIEKFLLDGWSIQEPTHRWTDGFFASLQLSLSGNCDSDGLLRVRCKAFVPSAKPDHQLAQICANGCIVATWVVREEAWYEAIIPRNLLASKQLTLTFLLANPTSPNQHNLSSDKRLLGLYVRALALSAVTTAPKIDWVGNGMDATGNVLRRGGKYFRAIRKSAMSHVAELSEAGVYRQLAEYHLIPNQTFSALDHSKYAALSMTDGARWNVYPADYAFLTLLDAARVWLRINELLLDIRPDRQYGLIDGHYGNFGLFGNSRPMWVDIGSIMPDAESRTAEYNGWFGLDQFIRCFVYPLQMYNRLVDDPRFVRESMHSHPSGLPHQLAAERLGDEYVVDVISQNRTLSTRRAALRRVREIVDGFECNQAKSTWSDYRNTTALNWALSGKYLETDQDSRFRKVVELAKRTKSATFVDVGANDGLFSILCAREGIAGIATDIDESALNKLYEFLGAHRELEITVAFSPFLNVSYEADLVLALALTHHLVLAQELSFAQVSEKLASICRRALITEFMPDGLGGVPGHPGVLPNPLPEHYSLEAYLEALRQNFRSVKVVQYDRSNPISRRTMICCEKSS